MRSRVVVLLLHGSVGVGETNAYVVESSAMAVRAAPASLGYDVARRERPDLIAIDLSAPVANVWAICRVLKADPQTADIPVVMLAEGDSQGTVAHARYAGARAVLPRPLMFDWLGLSVEGAP